MAENKKSFILYADILQTVSKLNDSKAGKLFKTILEYVNDKNPEVTDMVVDLVFEPIKQQLKRDLKKYEAIKTKRSEAGKQGGRGHKAKKANALFVKQTKANKAVTVNDTDTVTDNVRERDHAPEPDLKNSNLFRKPVIPTKQAVWETFSRAGGTKEMAKSFYEKHEGMGWYLSGSPIVNYIPLAQKFISTWNSIDGEKKETNFSSSAPPLKTNV